MQHLICPVCNTSFELESVIINELGFHCFHTQCQSILILRAVNSSDEENYHFQIVQMHKLNETENAI